MTFDEYIELKSRCDQYKISAIMAIHKLLNNFNLERVIPSQSTFYSVDKDSINYVIRIDGGITISGKLDKNTFQDLMNK